MNQSFGKPRQSIWFWLGPLLFMSVVGLYFVVRFDGYWAEADSSSFTMYIRGFVDKGKLIPNPDMANIYPNGYAYQALSTFVVALTGLKVETLQQWVYPLLAAIVVLPAWIAYRELTGSSLGGTLATLLLLTQPEFLFVILRSSHEKFTRMLMLLCLFLLFRSISQRQPFKGVSIYAGLFYFILFACIASNYILATSFIFAIVLVYLLGGITEKLKPHLKAWNNNLTIHLRYMIPICLGLMYIFAFHIYPPARHTLAVAQQTWDLIKTLFLGIGTQNANVFVAYDYTTFGWINLPTYFVLSIANWIMLIVSFAIWLRQSWSWIRHSEAPKSQMTWLLWLFYAAFAIQEVMAAISDASGALSSNLQLRLFPSFSMIAVAMIGAEWAEWRPLRFQRMISIGLTSILFCITIVSVLKATNEPLFSNKWNFYHPNELLALKWADVHLHNADVWTEFDERLTTAYLTDIGESVNRFTYYITPNTRDLMLSTITRLRSIRLRRPPPVPPDAFQVYDNGTAQLYHIRPRTPYQR
jgi:hypothetical protein